MTQYQELYERREIADKLDAIAEALGRGSAELLNAVHACRPGHPLNKVKAFPFLNLWFMAANRLPHPLAEWLREQMDREAKA